MSAGNTSSTRGIFAGNRQNITVRHCNVRGFLRGIYLSGGAGHLIEDNRLDNNLLAGIHVVNADDSLVQRNRMFDTGGSPGGINSFGIVASADILDNTVSGVSAIGTNAYQVGINAIGYGARVRGNSVRGLVVAGAGDAIRHQCL